MKNRLFRFFSLYPKAGVRLVLAALIALMGFSSCSRSLFGKRDKSVEEKNSDIEVVPTLPPDKRPVPIGSPDERPIRVLYGVPPRSYLWQR